jgi:hypothetical protein
MKLAEAGLNYLKRGVSLIPFKRDKNGACIKTWTPYQKQHPSKEDVMAWFQQRFSHEFIALVTGNISNLTVVDCDSQQAYDMVQESMPDGFITPICKSPHGYHIYFQHTPGLQSKRYTQDVDVKTDGGLIIAPPSENGNGLAYKWLPGLSFDKLDPAPMPKPLYSLLLSFNSSSYIGGVVGGDVCKSEEYGVSTSVYNGNKCTQYFIEGRRDQDLFHIANCLLKGRCEKDMALEVVKIIAKNCNPPLDEKEAEIKFKSADSRQTGRERNLAAEIREWVLSTNGNFLSTNIYTDLQLSTRDERKNVSIALKRLESDQIIEKSGSRNGEFRLRDQDCAPVDWLNADCSFRDLWLPLSLGEVCGVQPGNVLIFAGSKDAGKTAFLMNAAKENRHRYKTHYINSEMSINEWKMRVTKFDDITPEIFNRNVFLYNKSTDLHQYIKPGEENLNIIDYLEAPDEVWKIGPMIKKIYDALKGAICIIGIQKKIGQDLGRGAEFSMEKARLYVSLEYGKAKIVSCKNFKDNEVIKGNPRGYTCQYKLVNGCKILKQPPGWTSPVDKPKGD